MDIIGLINDYALMTKKGISMFYGGVLVWFILGLLNVKTSSLRVY